MRVVNYTDDSQILTYFFLFLKKKKKIITQDRARELAETIGGDALSLADLDTFNPEGGMILANTTSIGMHPKIDETPISKVQHLTILLSHYELLFWS